MTIQAVAKNLVNLIYPLHCAICKSPMDPLADKPVCGVCISGIRHNFDRARTSDTPGRIFFDKAYSACLYEGNLKELIHMFKYNGKASLGKILSGIMVDFVKNNQDVLEGIDMITFVPLRSSRLRKRGFNQSKVLAFNISKEFSMICADTLKKTSSTRNQNELSKDERSSNLDGAFTVRKNSLNKIDGSRLLLIDDVMTTGATLNECSKTLIEGGAESVTCLTLARGL